MASGGSHSRNRHLARAGSRSTHGSLGFDPTSTVGSEYYGPGLITQEQVPPGYLPPFSVGSGILQNESLILSKFTLAIRPPVIVDSLPALPHVSYPDFSTVVLTTDGKLYRNDGGTWTAAVPTVDLDGEILTAQLADLAVTLEKVAPLAIDSTKITDLAITTPKLAAGSVVAAKIGAGEVIAEKLAAGSVTTEKMSANTINGDRITAGTLAASKLVADSITAGQIAVGAIGASEIAAGAVRAGNLEVGMLPSRNMLVNGGFRNGLTGWTTGEGSAGRLFAMWNQSGTDWTLADGDADNWNAASGPYGSTAYMYAPEAVNTSYGVISQTVPATAGEYYSISGLVGNHGCGLAYLELKFFDGANNLLAAAGSSGGSLALNGGANRAGWSYLTIDGYLAPTGTKYAQFLFTMVQPRNGGTYNYMFCDQAWMGVGKVARSFDPQEVRGLRNASAKTIINNSGIAVIDGQISVTNPGGTVIIDGTSNMLKVMAEGELIVNGGNGSGAGGGRGNTSTNVPTGQEYVPKSLSYLESFTGSSNTGENLPVTIWDRSNGFANSGTINDHYWMWYVDEWTNSTITVHAFWDTRQNRSGNQAQYAYTILKEVAF